MGDVVGDGAEHRFTPCMRRLPTTMTSASIRSASSISTSPGLPSMAAEVALIPCARNAAACCSAICSAVVRLEIVKESEPTWMVEALRPE